MNKLKFNYIIDLVMLISFVTTALSGLILFIFLPGGFPQAGCALFLDVTRRTWIDVHHWAGIITIILVLVHLILHLNWIAQVTKTLFKFGSQSNNQKES